MRKPRDFDSELRALSDKAKLLKERKLHQLGELIVSIGADAPARRAPRRRTPHRDRH